MSGSTAQGSRDNADWGLTVERAACERWQLEHTASDPAAPDWFDARATTTCRVAKRLGRQFIGIELTEEYVALAQERCGLDVDDPSLLTDDDQRGLAAYTDGGRS